MSTHSVNSFLILKPNNCSKNKFLNLNLDLGNVIIIYIGLLGKLVDY